MINSIPMNEFVTDTMALVLRLERRVLGPKARSIFDNMEAGSAIIYVPGLVFAEILYLSEKGRITLTLQKLKEYMDQFLNCKECPMSLEVIQSAAQVTDVRELHDRLIAGTARFLNVELITNAPVIIASTFVRTVW